MTDRDLMQQALEALQAYGAHTPNCDHLMLLTSLPPQRKPCSCGLVAAITALRKRLAQPEQEPVAWGVFDGPNLHDVNFTKEEAHEMARLKGDGSVVKPLYTSTQPQMQPCAGRNCGSTNPNLHSAECFEDYEKSTGMNQWVGLTDEEKIELWNKHENHWRFEDNLMAFTRAIEAKLREKNHG